METGKELEINYQIQSSDLAKALSTDPKDDFQRSLLRQEWLH
jgi:hypothetical protein